MNKPKARNLLLFITIIATLIGTYYIYTTNNKTKHSISTKLTNQITQRNTSLVENRLILLELAKHVNSNDLFAKNKLVGNLETTLAKQSSLLNENLDLSLSEDNLIKSINQITQKHQEIIQAQSAPEFQSSDLVPVLVKVTNLVLEYQALLKELD